MNDHERGFLEFLAEPARRRVRSLLELGEKRRAQVRALLDHTLHLDPRFTTPLLGKAASAGSIIEALRERGAPATCYLVTSNADLDGREMHLGEALGAVVGSGDGAYVSCIAGRLAYYEYGEAQSSFLLVR